MKYTTITHGKPHQVTEASYGVPMGWYVDCDSAVCRSCAPDGFASGDYSAWSGFEGWESPLAICYDDESDSVTHCTECGAVIARDLTPDGVEYVMNAIGEFIAGNGHNAEVMAQWWLAYEDVIDNCDLREIIARAMVARGCTEFVPNPTPAS